MSQEMSQDVDMESLESGSTLTNCCSIDEPKPEYDQLRKQHDAQLHFLSQHFDSLKNLLDQRHLLLADELNKVYAEKLKKLDSFYANSNKENQQTQSFNQKIEKLLNETFEFKTDVKTVDRSNFDFEKVIKNYGVFIKKTNNTQIFDCKLSGLGLKQAYVNEMSKFTMSFNNAFNKSKVVSQLDVFIITESRTNIALIETGCKKTPLRNSFNTKNSKNCECKLECVSDGVYSVNYKLDKKGSYLLNILLNKKHVGESPYVVKCVEKKKVEMPKKSVKAQSSYSIVSNSSCSNNSDLWSQSVTSTDLNRSVKTNQSAPVLQKEKTSSLSDIMRNRTGSVGKRMPSSFSYTSRPSLSNSTLDNNTVFDEDSLLLLNLKTNSTPHNQSPAVFSPKSPSFSIDPAIQRKDDLLFKIGSRGRGFAEFANPQAVRASIEHYYVSDSNNQRVDVFSRSGDYKFSLGASLNAAKTLRRPVGIEITSDNRVLVADYEQKCVYVFDEGGKFLSRICLNKLIGPKGICVNRHAQNQIIVADAKGNSVCIFDSDGKFVKSFGNLGNKNENFAGPQYVACLSNGDIVVTDFYNHCIKVFDANGQFRFSFGTNGENQGQFSGPTGVATDELDNIIVADWGNCRIQIFDKYGTFMRYVNCEFNKLYGPQDLTLAENTIVVADSGNHCIKIFNYE